MPRGVFFEATILWPGFLGQPQRKGTLLNNVAHNPNFRWGISWICLALAIALHVADEALTGFLPLYNAVVDEIRATYSWFPMPTFTFRTWLSALVSGVIILLALSPFVFFGQVVMRYLSFFLSVVMIANALGHVAVSVYLWTFAPGVYSSPFLFAAAVFLFSATRRAR